MSNDFHKLRGKIVEEFGTCGAFAKALNCDINTVSRKLNGKSSFSRDDILQWASALNIPQGDIGIYFFTSKVR